ncbi:Hint domain-containing protein [Maritimibacter sp. DP1N21-5]|uniref:Hint domain-containing protein n=1 Tax=Maritimibacter sp. DP1N21-5 TaxID=2836867 RepID=UPI001C46585C|nr:Hint domain-containing protein [Maritimibacter sp. DP1N21-5]MBV7409940.1 Hint domain-containing protein [Maritimibacter sp. DP1N21-5]
MLHFRSPAVDRDLDPGLGLQPEGRGGSPLSVFSPSGLAPSAVLETVNGPTLARDVKTGDQLVTRDNGPAVVRWVGESMTMYDTTHDDASRSARGPVRIKAGALETDPDAGNLVLNAGHRLLVRSPLNELYFGTEEVIAEVGDLTHLDGVDFVPRSVMRFRHILLDTHELLCANGIWMESFSPEMWAIRVAFPDQYEEITEAVPRLKFETGEANYICPRMALNSREARLLQDI